MQPKITNKKFESSKSKCAFLSFNDFTDSLSTLFTIYIGGSETIAGHIQVGDIATFVIYVNMLTWPVASLGWVTSIVQRSAASQNK